MTRRKTRRGGSSAKPPLLGIGNMDGSNAYLASANPSGMAGADTGFWCACLVQFAYVADGLYGISSLAGASGWGFVTGLGGLTFRAANGAGTVILAPVGTYEAGKAYAAVGVHDGSNVRLYLNGAQVDNGINITGYTPRNDIAYVGAGGPTDGYLSFYGAAYGLGVPSSQNILDWYGQVRAQRRVVDMPGAPASRLWRPTAGAADMTDLIGGSVTLSKFGAGHTALSLTSPNWG